MKSLDERLDEYDRMICERFNPYITKDGTSTGDKTMATNHTGGADLQDKPFPVINPPKGCPTHVPWSALDEEMAYKNHRQTLSRLAERGGLNVIEIYLNYHKIDIKDFRSISQQDAIALINMLNDK